MSLLKGEKMLMAFEYDFAKDGGAIGEIALRPAAGNFPEGARIINAYAVAEELVTSSGTPTMEFGINGATGRYIGDSFTELSAAPRLKQNAVSELATASDVPVMTVASAALTAGKVKLYLEILL